MRTLIPINIPAWWLIIMPVLLITLIGIIVLIVTNIVNTKYKNTDNIGEENKGKYSKDKTLTSWIKKKDLLYWLLIICLGTISLFTFRYKDATEVVSHWGFAGTIVSIILAVVAIGFTLFQTLSSNLSSEKIAVSADKIESATINLDTATLVESGKIMKDAADFLKKEIEFIKKDLTIIKDETKHNNSKWEEQIKDINQSVINTREELVKLEDFQNEVFGKLPYYPKLFIYAFFQTLRKQIKIDSEMTNELSNILIDYEFKISEDNSKERRNYEEGANLASMATTHALMDHLGILNAFQKESSQKQEQLLELCRANLTDFKQYLKLIDEYFDKL
ncbi:hypothetical protein [Lysinibacillus sp. 38-6]|uniref:hypothetical protein n=1 Tax=Lysinibacillus sp. 38-6 TaxID=3385991 RepID=UPI00390893D7